MKVKRTSKSRTPTSRRLKKTRVQRPKKSILDPAKKKKRRVIAKKEIAVKLPVEKSLRAVPADDDMFMAELSPFAALNDEYALAAAWDILGDEEYLLDDEVWNTLYSRIKLQLAQTTYAFHIDTDGAALSPYSVTPLPAFRAPLEPGFLNAGNFTLLRPELPGVVFNLKITAGEDALQLDWTLSQKETRLRSGHIALYLDGELVEAVNLVQNRCRLELMREDVGDVSFYFIDADIGKQTKILELNI
ncbi:MAG: hypothetical protein JSR44_03280 [Spirochaetes bacterium]|nr:hypothetical protein [Spirochaetota bacterium]